MKSLGKQRRIQVIALSCAAALACFAAFYAAAPDAIQYYRSPSQLMAEPPPAGEVFRLGGLVEEGSVERGAGAEIRFVVTDGGASVSVVYAGVLPDLFSEGQGMIGTGSYVDGVFRATGILAKHDEEYMPREVAESLKEQGVYREP